MEPIGVLESNICFDQARRHGIDTDVFIRFLLVQFEGEINIGQLGLTV